MEKTYDSIVIGAGIAGLGVSGLLAKAGKKVLLVEKKKNVGGRAATFKKDGIVRSIGQHAALNDLQYDRLLNMLGVQGPEKALFSDLLMLHEGEFKSLMELLPMMAANVDPEEIARMQSVVMGETKVDLEELDDMPGDVWAKKYLSSDFIINLLRMASTIMTTIPRLEEMAASTVYETMIMLTKSMSTWLAANGMSEFLDAMAEKMKENGGTVITNATVKSILIENNKATGILVGENIVEDIEGEYKPAEKVEAPLIISAAPIWEIFRMIPEENFPEDFVQKVRNVGKLTANIGIAAALRKPVYDGQGLIMVDFPSVGYPGTVFMPTNVCPNLAPEGVQLFEASIICDESDGKDEAKKHRMMEGLEKDLQTFFPDWDKDALWISHYFHYEEPKRTAGRAGKNRPGVKAPGIENLYFCGDAVASRALPGMECAADSAMICAEAILGELPA